MDKNLSSWLANLNLIWREWVTPTSLILSPPAGLQGRNLSVLPRDCYKYVLGFEKQLATHVTANAAAEPDIVGGLTCFRCNFHNEYAGREHLKDGKYICFNCK